VTGRAGRRCQAALPAAARISRSVWSSRSDGGSVVWSNNPRSGSFDLALVATNAQGLVVVDNPGVDALDFDVHVIGSGPITIQNNPMLPTCIALDYASAQTAGGWSGPLTVSGNEIGPCP